MFLTLYLKIKFLWDYITYPSKYYSKVYAKKYVDKYIDELSSIKKKNEEN